MVNYYVALDSRSHALLLERRMTCEGVVCELAYTPRELMRGVCNMAVRFTQSEYFKAVPVIHRAGLPGCRLFREELQPDGADYYEEVL